MSKAFDYGVKELSKDLIIVILHSLRLYRGYLDFIEKSSYPNMEMLSLALTSHNRKATP